MEIHLLDSSDSLILALPVDPHAAAQHINAASDTSCIAVAQSTRCSSAHALMLMTYRSGQPAAQCLQCCCHAVLLSEVPCYRVRGGPQRCRGMCRCTLHVPIGGQPAAACAPAVQRACGCLIVTFRCKHLDSIHGCAQWEHALCLALIGVDRCVVLGFGVTCPALNV